MSLLIPHVYYRLVCMSCRLAVETKDCQYHRCPGCGSVNVTSARAERWEGFEASLPQQRDANEEIAKMLKKLPSEES